MDNLLPELRTFSHREFQRQKKAKTVVQEKPAEKPPLPLPTTNEEVIVSKQRGSTAHPGSSLLGNAFRTSSSTATYVAKSTRPTPDPVYAGKSVSRASSRSTPATRETALKHLADFKGTPDAVLVRFWNCGDGPAELFFAGTEGSVIKHADLAPGRHVTRSTPGFVSKERACCDDALFDGGRVRIGVDSSLDVPSRDDTVPLAFKFVNNHELHDVSVYWLDYDGNRTLRRTLQPSEAYVDKAFATHVFVLHDCVDKKELSVCMDRTAVESANRYSLLWRPAKAVVSFDCSLMPQSEVNQKTGLSLCGTAKGVTKTLSRVREATVRDALAANPLRQTLARVCVTVLSSTEDRRGGVLCRVCKNDENETRFVTQIRPSPTPNTHISLLHIAGRVLIITGEIEMGKRRVLGQVITSIREFQVQQVVAVDRSLPQVPCVIPELVLDVWTCPIFQKHSAAGNLALLDGQMEGRISPVIGEIWVCPVLQQQTNTFRIARGGGIHQHRGVVTHVKLSAVPILQQKCGTLVLRRMNSI